VHVRLLTLMLLAAALAPMVPAQAAEVLDRGTYHVYLRDRALGFENFEYDDQGDSLVVHAYVLQTPAGPTSKDTLVKDMVMIANPLDYDIREYHSSQQYLGHVVQRGLRMSETSYEAMRQIDQRGESDVLERPPGRVYIHDPQVYVLYDYMCRTLHRQTFDERPVQLLFLGAMGAADTLLEATATDLGTEKIRWGARPVQARKLRIWYSDVEFFVWISPQGKMLRLTQPVYGLRVEREAPPVKSRNRSSG
jgi:hypothetical protein